MSEVQHPETPPRDAPELDRPLDGPEPAAMQGAEAVPEASAERVLEPVAEPLAEPSAVSTLAKPHWFVAGAKAMFHLAIERSYARVGIVGLGFALVFATISGRLVYMAAFPEADNGDRRIAAAATTAIRPDIIDRNGEILATDIRTVSIFAEPRNIYDKDEAVELLTAVLPQINATELRAKLSTKKGFVWVKREITPKQQAEVHRLGIPGIGFLPDHKRVYPNGTAAAHILGITNLDNVGIAGIEKYIDNQGNKALNDFGLVAKQTDLKPVQLSIDLRAQFAVRDELAWGLEHFKAKAAAAMILDVQTGEVIALASLPDFDPNDPADALNPDRINRMNVGVYEMGSTFKAMTLAMALDSGKFNVNSTFDTRGGVLNWGRQKIHEYHGTNRVITMPEVFTHSSNIGSAKMALGIGVPGHKAFLKKMGLTDRVRTELPESAEPIVPSRWTEINTITIAFGHGLAVAPIQATAAVAAIANGGFLMTPTFLKTNAQDAMAKAVRVLKPETSEAMRFIMRLNARRGFGQEGGDPVLLRGRQDRHGREGDPRPLRKEPPVHDLHGGGAHEQPEIPLRHHHGRAAGPAGIGRLRHRRLEFGRRHRPGDRAGRPRARPAAAIRSAREALPADGEARRLSRDPVGREMSARTLGALFPEAEAASADLPVTGLTADSRKAGPGTVFVAVPGVAADGRRFAAKAAAAGAVAVVGEGTRPADLDGGVPYVAVADVRRSLALAARAFSGRQPAHVIAVTGTSGKSSVTDFVRQILSRLAAPAASLGTVGIVTDRGATYGSLTTPDPVSLQATLADLADDGIAYLAMEASSHGIEQRRLDGVDLAAVGYTNLGRDHLDYHATMDEYLAAKLRLFTTLARPGIPAVINRDGAYADIVVAAASARGLEVHTTGTRGDTVRLEGARTEGFHQHLALQAPGPSGRLQDYAVRLPLVGGSRSRTRSSPPASCWRPPPAGPTRRASSPPSNTSPGCRAGWSASGRRGAGSASSTTPTSRKPWRACSPPCGPSRPDACA